MDVVRNIQVDFAIIKEPRGFLRVIQFVLSILAFATICSSATAYIKVTCTTGTGTTATSTTTDLPITYKYPFNLHGIEVDAPFCSNVQRKMTPFEKVSFASAPQFFCFIGVMSFLLCIAYCIGYIVFSPLFANESRGAMIDFIFSVVWTLMWFIASTAWADRLSVMGTYLKPQAIIADDLMGTDYCKAPAASCNPGEAGSHATLVVSVLFGYLNMLVWGAGIWFLFKETRWHKELMPGAGGSERFDEPHAEAGASSYQQPDTSTTEPTPNTTGY